VPGLQEWLVVGLIALIIIGPNRLPDVARTAGHLLARLRHEVDATKAAIRNDAALSELEDELRALRGEVRATKRAAGDTFRGATGSGDHRYAQPTRDPDENSPPDTVP
jgi:sec-independent protein translocase protein TatB